VRSMTPTSELPGRSNPQGDLVVYTGARVDRVNGLRQAQPKPGQGGNSQ